MRKRERDWKWEKEEADRGTEAEGREEMGRSGEQSKETGRSVERGEVQAEHGQPGGSQREGKGCVHSKHSDGADSPHLCARLPQLLSSHSQYPGFVDKALPPGALGWKMPLL